MAPHTLLNSPLAFLLGSTPRSYFLWNAQQYRYPVKPFADRLTFVREVAHGQTN